MQQTQTQALLEQDRQRKINEERNQNLQYAAIALGLVTLLICFLVISHSVVANQKLIKFLGVVSLLLVFEFLNLWLHPILGEFTHHSPVQMLFIMVGIAALLVPMHHKLEHWLIDHLVEKNNRIRLAAAKRIIKTLEGAKGEVVQDNNSNTRQQVKD